MSSVISSKALVHGCRLWASSKVLHVARTVEGPGTTRQACPGTILRRSDKDTDRRVDSFPRTRVFDPKDMSVNGRVHRLLALFRNSIIRSGFTSTGESGSDSVRNCSGSLSHGGVGSGDHGGFGSGRSPEGTDDARPGLPMPSPNDAGASSSSTSKFVEGEREDTSLTSLTLVGFSLGIGGKGGKGGPGMGGVL